jgi:hypothetical protein
VKALSCTEFSLVDNPYASWHADRIVSNSAWECKSAAVVFDRSPSVGLQLQVLDEVSQQWMLSDRIRLRSPVRRPHSLTIANSIEKLRSSTVRDIQYNRSAFTIAVDAHL